MGPWLVGAMVVSAKGPATWVVGLQVLPPFVEEMNPTFSEQGAHDADV